MNLKETVIEAIHRAADEGYDTERERSGDGQLTISVDTLSIVGFSKDKDGALETVLANVSSIADLIISVVSNEIAELILKEGPWCDNQDHIVDTETGKSPAMNTCPCYAFSAKLARGV